MRISDWSSDVCSSDLLQVAYYLGFKEVILIGMDHRYEYTGDPNQTQVLDGPDLNHFSSDYFGHGQHWDNPDLAHSEESYRIARAEYERDGRRILDATLDGACDIFEKVDHPTLGLHVPKNTHVSHCPILARSWTKPGHCWCFSGEPAIPLPTYP